MLMITAVVRIAETLLVGDMQCKTWVIYNETRFSLNKLISRNWIY